MNDTIPTESTAPAPKKSHKLGVIVASAAAAVVLIAAIAVPTAIAANAHNGAVAGYNAATNELNASVKTADTAQKSALVTYAYGKGMLDMANPVTTEFDSVNDVSSLGAALGDFGSLAKISVAADGTVSATAITVPKDAMPSLRLTESASTEQLIEATTVLKATSAELKSTAAQLSAAKMLKDSELALVASAEKSGTAWQRPARATDDSWNAYVAALAAIKAENLKKDSDLMALTKTYLDTRKAVQDSNDQVVAAEQVAAQQAAQDAARKPVAQQSHSGTGSKPGGSTGGSKSGGSAGGTGSIPGGGGIGHAPAGPKGCSNGMGGTTLSCP